VNGFPLERRGIGEPNFGKSSHARTKFCQARPTKKQATPSCGKPAQVGFTSGANVFNGLTYHFVNEPPLRPRLCSSARPFEAGRMEQNKLRTIMRISRGGLCRSRRTGGAQESRAEMAAGLTASADEIKHYI
jgi:hypothetical protein